MVTLEQAEDQVQKVAELLGLNGHDQLGGGLVGFMFAHPKKTKKNLTVTFGYANGPLGFCESDDTGEAFKSGEMPEKGPHDAESQAAFIRASCKKLGYKIVPDLTDEKTDKIRADYFEAKKAERAKIVEEAQDAFWAVIAEKFPKAKSGDFMPDASMDFDSACEKAVEHWLAMNLPLEAMQKEVA